jgi:hypothetical protein
VIHCSNLLETGLVAVTQGALATSPVVKLSNNSRLSNKIFQAKAITYRFGFIFLPL